MTDDLPEGWASVSVGSVVSQLKYGTAKKCSYEKRGVPVLRIPNVVSGTIDHTDLKYASLPSTELEGLRLRPGDILVIRSNGSVSLVGRSALVRERERGFAFAGYLIRLRPTEAIVPEFLNLALGTHETRLQIELEARSTSGVNNLNAEEINALALALPPLLEQRRLVAKVQALLEAVQSAQQRVDKIPAILKRFRQAVLNAACNGKLTADWRAKSQPTSKASQLATQILRARRGIWERRQASKQRAGRYPEPFSPDPDVDLDIPESWSVVTVSQLSLLDVGFAFKSSEFASSGIRLLRGENVEPGRLRWTETKYWPKKALADVDDLLIENGEIILALDRPLISSGLKIARATSEDLPCLLVQRVMRFKMADPRTTEWLYYNLQLRRFIGHLSKGLTGTDLPHVTGTGVAEFTIGLPPMEEQQEIARRIESMFTLADRLETRYAKAKAQVDRLTQSVLAKAFRGELVPTEAELARREGREYETAEQLLERIKNEQRKTAEEKGRQHSKHANEETTRPRSGPKTVATTRR